MTTSAATRRASLRKTPTSSSSVLEELPRDTRCEYPSKFCNNHKALKTKGGMHKFCEFHRRKANLNQKRWQQRRRELRDQRDADRAKYAARSPSAAEATTPTKNDQTALEALSPLDVIEPFPISQFTTTPPPMASDAIQPMENSSIGVNTTFSQSSGFAWQDDLDVLSTLFFSDTQSMYNWPSMAVDTGFLMGGDASGYTLTGSGAAIV